MYEKFKRLLDANNVTPYKVAKETGIATTTFTEWKKGNYTPKKDKIQKIADYFGVPISYFYEEQTFEVSAGNGRINDDFGDGRIINDEPEYSTVRICGDSMYPSLHDGDLVKVHHIQSNDTNIKYAIVKINGDESTCKHIEITSDGIWLRAENKEVYKDKFFTVQEVLTLPVTIIGKAISIIEREL